MALIIIGGAPWSGAQRGIELNEVGIAVRRFQVRYFPQINERLEDNVGEVIARAQSDKWSREITVEGEITAPGTGIMAFVLGTACVVANDVLDFGPTTPTPIPGKILMDEGTVTQERAGWRNVSVRLSSNPYLV